MPIYAHGLVGFGVGAASVHSARSPACRRGWIGCAVFLAYVPDLTDWLARTCGYETMPVSAMSSIPMAAMFCVAFLLMAQFWWRERSAAIRMAGLAAIGSHWLLDWADGGVPVWWPFSNRLSGPDLFRLHSLGAGERLVREVALFGWAALLGLAVFAVREARGSSPRVVIQRPIAGRLMWQSAWMWPVLALGGVQGYILSQQMRGDVYWDREDYAGALPFYERSTALASVDGASRLLLFKIGHCHYMLGQEEGAYRAFTHGLRLHPDSAGLYIGLAELYLTAKDPRYYRPAEVPWLAEKVRQYATRDYERRDAERLTARARRALSTTTHNAE
jgi:hypothetical protein